MYIVSALAAASLEERMFSVSSKRGQRRRKELALDRAEAWVETGVKERLGLASTGKAKWMHSDGRAQSLEWWWMPPTTSHVKTARGSFDGVAWDLREPGGDGLVWADA